MRTVGLSPSTLLSGLVALVSIAGCTTEANVEPTEAALVTSAGQKEALQPVHFIEDDFEGALAKAKAEGKLLFIDAWAPWCHTCLSMRDVVLHRPELGRFDARYVFVAIDTDRPSAAPFLERYRLRVWPTFFVVDPNTRAVLAVHGGSASLEEMSALLDRTTAPSKDAPAPGVAELLKAHQAYAEKRLEDAAKLYEEASTRLPDDRRTEALVARMRTLYEAKIFETCVDFGREHAASVKGSSAPSDFVMYMNECASGLTDEAKKKEAKSFVRARLEQLVKNPPPGTSVDDRADTMAVLASILRDGKEDAAARAVEEQRVAILDEAAKAAPTPETAQTYDYARMGAYLALGRGEEAVKMFEERIEQLPNSYEAHARLASALGELKRHAEAAKAYDKAIALSYGPRKLRYMAAKANAQKAAGDLPGAIATVEAELKGWQELPPGQKDDVKTEETKKRLEKLREGGRK